MDGEEFTITTPTQGNVSFRLTDTLLLVKHSDSKCKEIPHRQVIKAAFDTASGSLEVAYLTKKTKKKYMSLTSIHGQVQDEKRGRAGEWAESVMQSVYEDAGVKRARRLKVLVNPHGGTKQAVALFIKIVEPILRTAGCHCDVIHTTHQGHAYEIAKDLTLDYDAIITVSGDGLIHEVMNGIAQHADPIRAFSIPIAPIPTGSGNGLSLNLLGITDGLDVAVAALNVIKGRPMKVDLFSFTQNGKRTVSFMSQALGLMADLDVGTEHLRWMGDVRFMVGLIRGIIQFKPCPVQLSFKVAENDKAKMAASLRTRQMGDDDGNLASPVSFMSEESVSDALPPLKYLHEDEDGWTTFDEPLLYVYAGKGPYVGRDFMAFPVSWPNDGLIDVMAMPVSSRKDILTGMAGAHKGESFWHPRLHYVKAHAYRVKPLKSTGYLAVDGEIFPFEEFQVEVHQGLGTFLSPYGRYAVDFTSRNPLETAKSDVMKTEYKGKHYRH
ncbi:ATP-NAD kinase-like domain-containing protein [Crucibulum laeve]|uniref:ATP-NAD kinase-like domain-containing protein n=1 Tax=Crucibulum laeve TaxID=68775 RepID=A0A5C3MAQ5_9AGAR|nr:ATP-NAD kinase-like domain-containing protein [Crucibulum laeve]